MNAEPYTQSWWKKLNEHVRAGEYEQAGRFVPDLIELARKHNDKFHRLFEAESIAKHLASHLERDPSARAAFDKYWQQQQAGARPLEEVMAELEMRDEANRVEMWLRSAPTTALVRELGFRQLSSPASEKGGG